MINIILQLFTYMRQLYIISLICCLSGLMYAQIDNVRIDTIAQGFISASALAIDPKGNIYVSDAGADEIVKLAPDGNILTRIGGYGWTTTALDRPSDIISPNGLDIYVADYGNRRILRFDQNLNLISLIPPEGNSERIEHVFGYPISIGISSFGKLFILDDENKRLVKISSINAIERIIGGNEAGRGKLRSPRKMRIDSHDYIYIQDENEIIAFDVFGNYLRSFGKGLFKAFKAFTIDNDSIVVIDSCMLYELDTKGKKVIEFSLCSLLGEYKNLQDILVAGKYIYLLTKHDLLIVRKDDVL